VRTRFAYWLAIALMIVGCGDDTSPPTASGYQQHLKVIAGRLATLNVASSPPDQAWRARTADALRTIRESLATIDALARRLERHVNPVCAATTAPLAAVTAELVIIGAEIDHSATALDASIDRRIAQLQNLNQALTWLGPRGSREHELNELYAAAHAVDVTLVMREVTLDRFQAAAKAYFGARYSCA
jgi:hypothetical protein